jgi:hypothetical protein
VNDWKRIGNELFAEPGAKRGTCEQAWRWSAGARDWLDRHGIEARDAGRSDALRFVSEVPTDGVTDPSKRMWAFNVLVRAARSVSPPVARRPDTARAVLDRIPARSPLGVAIARVLSGARTEHDRRAWPTCLGSFLQWCDSCGIDPMRDLWPGHIDAFRRDYLESRGTSPGEYARVARRLLREIGNRLELAGQIAREGV